MSIGHGARITFLHDLKGNPTMSNTKKQPEAYDRTRKAVDALKTMADLKRHLPVMEAYLAGAYVTLNGENVPNPKWVDMAGTYRAFKGGQQVAMSKPLWDGIKPLAEASPTPLVKVGDVFEFARKGLGTIPIRDVESGDYAAGILHSKDSWRPHQPGYAAYVDPRMEEGIDPATRFDVITRDGRVCRQVPYSAIQWGPADSPSVVWGEVIRFRYTPALSYSAKANTSWAISHRLW